MKQYPRTYEEHSSYGSALRLVESSGREGGVVLDLGCGRSPLVEPLTARGFDHVGCDVDPDALADLRERGAETHEVSLSVDEVTLVARLDEVLDGRPLAAVLALDVLEHLVDPIATLRAVRTIAERRSAPLVVSIPNITHADIASKLLLGRWDLSDTGLLDDTHLRFFSIGELDRLLAAGGWDTVAVDDVVLPLSDQAFPVDAPTVRPGAPLRELLRAVRGQADPHGEVYQFVRRLAVGEIRELAYRREVDEERPVVDVVVVVPAGVDESAASPLLGDLAAQTPPLTSVPVVGPADLHPALRGARGRWVAVMDARTRVSAEWSTTLTELAEVGAGRLIRTGAVVVPDGQWSAADGFTDVVFTDGASMDGSPSVDALDPLHAGAPGVAVPAAYLVPTEVVLTAGLLPPADMPLEEALASWVSRVALVSGVVGTEAALVAVPSSAVPDAGALASRVVAVLDDEPLVLPAGSSGRLAALRRRVHVAERDLAVTVGRLEAADHKASHLADQLRRLEHDHTAEREELAKLRVEHSRRLSRRLARLVRRLT